MRMHDLDSQGYSVYQIANLYTWNVHICLLVFMIVVELSTSE